MGVATYRVVAGARGVKHLNPRQGITTRLVSVSFPTRRSTGVKHLNPRQGITTNWIFILPPIAKKKGVKHLNPRQGITTRDAIARCGAQQIGCETPKSPPGDYNQRAGTDIA